MELISHIHANATFSSNQQNNSLENLASKQRIFRIVKEQHGFLSDRAIGRLLSGLLAEAKGNLDIALVRVLAGGGGRWELVEPAGIEPATSCLQSRRSPS